MNWFEIVKVVLQALPNTIKAIAAARQEKRDAANRELDRKAWAALRAAREAAEAAVAASKREGAKFREAP